MKTVIFDLDGTLCDITHRLHYIQDKRHVRWDLFFKACVDDKPKSSVVALNHIVHKSMLYSSGAEPYIILVSGRSDEVRKETEEWLQKHKVAYNKLIMRKAGDYRADDIVKEEFLDQLLAEGHEILFTVDDRQRVVDMWRRRGITCLQCDQWEERKKTVPLSSEKGLLTLLVGPSGAGKSSWLRGEGQPIRIGKKEYWTGELGIHSSHVVSSDQIRTDLCGNFRDQTKNTEVFAALHAIVKARIDHGLPTVIDATNIKTADRKAVVALADGGQVRYIVINRPMEEKYRDAEWRAEVGFDLIAKHENTFNSNLKEILRGDGLPNVTVIDLRRK